MASPVTLQTKVEVICANCEDVLVAKAEWVSRFDEWQVRVNPCERCEREAAEKAKEEAR